MLMSCLASLGMEAQEDKSRTTTSNGKILPDILCFCLSIIHCGFDSVAVQNFKDVVFSDY